MFFRPEDKDRKSGQYKWFAVGSNPTSGVLLDHKQKEGKNDYCIFKRTDQNFDLGSSMSSYAKPKNMESWKKEVWIKYCYSSGWFEAEYCKKIEYQPGTGKWRVTDFMTEKGNDRVIYLGTSSEAAAEHYNNIPARGDYI